MDYPVVAITGASGYVGSLIGRALASQAKVVPLVRTATKPGEREWSFQMGTDRMAQVLREEGVTHLIHAAWDMRANTLEQLKDTCVTGTQRLLLAAEAAAVHQIVFISTISAFDGARSSYGQTKRDTETLVLSKGGLVLRLGLVYGETNGGGVFGSLASLATRLPLIPVVTGGLESQYLLHEKSLATVLQRAIRGDFRSERRVLTLAHPKPIRLSELMQALAVSKGRRAHLIRVPWYLIYLLLRCAEAVQLGLRVRSDSIVSLVHQNPNPDFKPLLEHQIEMIPFNLSHR